MASDDRKGTSPPLTAVEKQAWNYLLEVVQDYSRYLSDIEGLGLSAPNLLYYRDEIQELLEEFKGDPRVDFRRVWEEVKGLDECLRRHQDLLVRLIGHANFRQYQIVNDPPRSHWWWWLNRVVAPPPSPPAWWKFWSKPAPSLYESELPSSNRNEAELERPPGGVVE